MDTKITNCCITGFATSKDFSNHKVVFVREVITDEVTGLDKEIKSTYLCNQSFHFIDFISNYSQNKIIKVQLLLKLSEKLGKYVVVDIRKGE